MTHSRVALIRGDDRYANIKQALEAIDGDVSLAGRERILIKVNFVSTSRALSATHPDAVRALLEFLSARGAANMSIAAGPAIGTTAKGFENYGYAGLIDQYRLQVVDLNVDETMDVELIDSNLSPMRLPVSKTMIESDLRISIGPPKTHDLVMVTLSLKNTAVGSLPSGKKACIHQNCPAVNLNLYRMAQYVAPHLAVIDGYQAMEGNGPVSGAAVDWRIALASADFCAADSLAAQLMGFPPGSVGYLHYCHLMGLGQGYPKQMAIVGNVSPEEVQRTFKRHSNFQTQVDWEIPNVRRYL